MSYLALDLSKRSAGWARWRPGMDLPECGTWELGSEVTSAGRAFLRLHQRLDEIHRATPIESIAYEKPLNLGANSSQTTEETLFVLIGLAAHVVSYAEARGVRQCRDVPMGTWRRHFLGPVPRGTRSADLKSMAMARCRELGMSPARHDAAEACGILDHSLMLAGIVPPWRARGRTLFEGRANAA